jgi:hypothetical protein
MMGSYDEWATGYDGLEEESKRPWPGVINKSDLWRLDPPHWARLRRVPRVAFSKQHSTQPRCCWFMLATERGFCSAYAL